MMAPSCRKGRDQKWRRRMSCFFPGGCCFGSFSTREHDNNNNNNNQYSKNMGKNIFLSNSHVKKVHIEAETTKSSGNKVVPAPPPAHLVINNKDIFLDKIKSLKESVIMDPIKSQSEKPSTMSQKIWSDPIKLSHSVSMPLPRRKKEKLAADGGDERRKDKDGDLMIVGEFDPMVGALIIMVTLIVMLIWGKVCAILCTAAWYYFLPRFRADYVMKLENGSKQIDFDSPEYKKKVVLQGFLERNQQT